MRACFSIVTAIAVVGSGCVSKVETQPPPAPSAATVTLTDPGKFHEAASVCAKEKRVLVIPNVRNFPVELWQALRQHLDAGGPVVFVGCDPFTARVRLRDGRTQTEEELFRELTAAARSVQGVSFVQEWRRENDAGKKFGPLRVEPSSNLHWPAVRVEMEQFHDWDAIMVDFPAGTITENSLAFQARGDPDTSRLAVQCVEEDGSHWSYVLGVGEEWQPFVLHEAKFHHFYGGANRGKDGDHLSLARVKKISVGLSMHLGAQQPGSHTFGVSEVRFVNDPRTVEQAVGWPDLMLLSPPYRRFDPTMRGTRTQSPIARALGTGGDSAAPYRWIPVNRTPGKAVCWPASIYIEPGNNGTTKKWAWVATEPADETLVNECARRLQRGSFLHHAGVSRFTFRQGDKIEATAQWTRGEPPVRALVELLADDGKVLQQTTSAPLSEPGRAVFDLGSAPGGARSARNCRVRISLVDAGDPKLGYDRIEQDIKVLSAPRAPASDEWVTTKGAYFSYQDRRLFLVGINYWPLNHNGKSPGEYNAHWLEPGAFDPEIIRRDLDRLREVGINAVSIQYHGESQAPQLQWFADECRKRGIWIHAFVGHLQPIYQDLKKAQRLIEGADLKNCPQVFALDVAWEPHLGNYDGRCRFDGQWQAWVEEQYGSVQHAEQVIGRPIPRREGTITSPSDEEFRTDGEHRALVAAYRRFVDDFMSRRYGEVERLVRRLGCRQLLSARSGYGGTGNPWADPYLPIDLAAGTVHFDFVSPEGYGLNGDLDQFREASFLTAYARGVSAGKPVAWLEFGCSVGANPQQADQQNQARLYRQMFELCERSKAAGCFGWWFPGGWRVDERSDFGVMNPDSTWRPAGEEYRKFAGRVSGRLSEPTAWSGRGMDRDADARGLSALWNKWRQTYRTEASTGKLQEIRPVGFGKLTTDIPLVSVGGRPFADPAPLQCANAEWGRIEMEGTELIRSPGSPVTVRVNRDLRLELINTGPATWVASEETKARTVWLCAKRSGAEPQLIAVRSVAFGQRTWIKWTPDAKGDWELRPLLKDVALFGESLDVEVQ